MECSFQYANQCSSCAGSPRRLKKPTFSTSIFGQPQLDRRLSRTLGKIRSRRRGSLVLQMLFALPVLLFIVFGMIEFAQFMYIRTCFNYAARDAARAASLFTAAAADPITKATFTLTQANVTFNPAWMTIIDVTNSNSTVIDCSTVTAGDTILVTIQCPYGQIPNAFRPLNATTGYGIGPGKMCSGQCQMVKEGM